MAERTRPAPTLAWNVATEYKTRKAPDERLEYLKENFISIDNPEDRKNFIDGVVLAHRERGSWEEDRSRKREAISELKHAVRGIPKSEPELRKTWKSVIDEVGKEHETLLHRPS
jgi:hypothetical protein